MSYYETKNGVRFNWNVLPATRLECSQLPVPVGCVVSPFSTKERPEPILGSNLALCRECRGYMNPFVEVAQIGDYWQCSFCGKRSFFANLEKTIPTQEYVEGVLGENISNGFSGSSGQCHVFVVDKYLHVDELEEAKREHGENETTVIMKTSFGDLLEQICTSVDQLPPGDYMALMTFDDRVHVSNRDQFVDLSTASFSIGLDDKLFENQDFKDYNVICNESSPLVTAIEQKLGLQKQQQLGLDISSSPLVIEITDLNKPIIKQLLRLLRPTLTHSFKPARVLGLSLYILSLIFRRYVNFRGHIYTFTSGPNTTNPGIILNEGDSLRSHHDIKQLNSNSNFKASLQFYEMLGYLANGIPLSKAGEFSYSLNKKSTTFEPQESSAKWTFYIFSGSLDQVGLYEMKGLALTTNGTISIAPSFKDKQFKDQFRKTFTTQIEESLSNVSLTVLTLRSLKISRMISHGFNLPSLFTNETQYHDKISDQLGEFDSRLKKTYFTNRWHWNLFTPNDTIAIFFEIEGRRSSFEALETHQYVQFVWRYWDKRKKLWFIRINTVRRPTTVRARDREQVKNLQLNLNNAKIDMLRSVDTETFITLFGRLIINKLDTNLGYDFDGTTELIDTALIKLLHNFDKLSIKSKTLNEVTSKITTYIYHLRRNNQIIQVFNSSPDETSYYHHWFLKLDSALSVVVIQPKLYKLLTEDNSVELDLNSDTIEQLQGNSLLVVDSVFSIIIYNHFEDDSRKLKLHNSNNDSLIESEGLKLAFDKVRDLGVKDRMVVPRYIITQTNHSQARFLILRLSPKRAAPVVIEEVEETLWLGLWFGGKTSLKRVSYDISKTDEVGFDDYCDGLYEMVERFRLE